MIVILLGWLALANLLPSLPSWGLQIYLLLIVHAQGKLHCAKRMAFLRFNFKIKLFQPFEHQFNAVQHFVYTGSKYTKVI